MADSHIDQSSGMLRGSVSYPGDGDSIDGYLARRSDGRTYPGIILIQEWWGIEAHIKELAERLAREGYVVLAPDLYHGAIATEPDEAMKQAMIMQGRRPVEEISRAIDYLQARDDVRPGQVGVVGFCMGGRLAWQIAQQRPAEIAAIAPFYAGHFDPTADEIRRVEAPALVVWGERDGSIPAEQRQKVVSLLQQEHNLHRVLTYPAGHAFLNNRHDTYDAASAEQAWGELLAWFKQYLG